ncbi:MAG: redoxin domain-containing protein [Capsulimonadales bacterium]|nr:redoxin domain-containing protein [Capsulimonadales bacterium]
MKRLNPTLLTVLAVAFTVPAVAQQTPSTVTGDAPTVSSVAPVKDLFGKTADVHRFSGRTATVLLFILRDCPIANAYAPEFDRIVNDFSRKKVTFYLVYADSDIPTAELRRHYREYGYHCSALSDSQRTLARRWKAQRTPEAVVIDRAGKVVYQGRIDDRYVDFGKARHLPSRRDLRLVLDALTENRPVAPTTTSVIGCSIPD